MGQLAEALNKRNPRALPNSIGINPREMCKAITLSCGKAYDPRTMPDLGDNDTIGEEPVAKNSDHRKAKTVFKQAMSKKVALKRREKNQ